MIEEGVASGEFTTDEPADVAWQFLGMVDGVNAHAWCTTPAHPTADASYAAPGERARSRSRHATNPERNVFGDNRVGLHYRARAERIVVVALAVATIVPLGVNSSPARNAMVLPLRTMRP